jgi:RimJ/RimL family protein N-acetyltransferase
MNMSKSATIHPVSNDKTADSGIATAGVSLHDWPLPWEKTRVALRALRAKDAEAFLGYRSDPEVARYQGWSTMDATAACEFIGTMESVTGPKAGAWIQLAIVLSGSDLLIGDIGLWLSNDGKAAQIGYSCARQFQRQGLTTEAVGALIDALVRFTPCEAIRATLDSRNTASERLLLGLSFQQTETATPVSDSSGLSELTYELDLRARSRGGLVESAS